MKIYDLANWTLPELQERCKFSGLDSSVYFQFGLTMDGVALWLIQKVFRCKNINKQF